MSAPWVEQDGTTFLKEVIDPRFLAKALGAACRWPSPAAFDLLPIWYPDTARKMPLYTSRWSKVMTNRGRDKSQSNEVANRALTRLVAKDAKSRQNWTCCHIWGNDDDRFQSSASEVNDPRYYSCPANMVLLPTPLKGLTDSIPEVRAALRIASHRLYGFVPQGKSVPTEDMAGDWLPEGWVEGRVSGVVEMTNAIETRINTRAKRLLEDFREAPNRYPKEQVGSVVGYWIERRPGCLLAMEETV